MARTLSLNNPVPQKFIAVNDTAIVSSAEKVICRKKTGSPEFTNLKIKEMKKLLLIMILIGGFSTMQAQIMNFGIKGGLNYNSNGDLRSLHGFENDLKISSDQQIGYHIGILGEIKLPLWLYIRPELFYTHTKSNYDENNYSADLTLNKIDAPVLLGIRVLHFGRIFIGPVFTYVMSTDLENTGAFDNIKKISSDDFSMGGQIGAGLEFGKFGADIRWESGLTDTEAQFVGDITNGYIDSGQEAKIKIDTRPQQFILSIYYKFK
jgi:hypothetical protein